MRFHQCRQNNCWKFHQDALPVCEPPGSRTRPRTASDSIRHFWPPVLPAALPHWPGPGSPAPLSNIRYNSSSAKLGTFNAGGYPALPGGCSNRSKRVQRTEGGTGIPRITLGHRVNPGQAFDDRSTVGNEGVNSKCTSQLGNCSSHRGH